MKKNDDFPARSVSWLGSPRCQLSAIAVEKLDPSTGYALMHTYAAMHIYHIKHICNIFNIYIYYYYHYHYYYFLLVLYTYIIIIIIIIIIF
jgi:hypothetical protein